MKTTLSLILTCEFSTQDTLEALKISCACTSRDLLRFRSQILVQTQKLILFQLQQSDREQSAAARLETRLASLTFPARAAAAEHCTMKPTAFAANSAAKCSSRLLKDGLNATRSSRTTLTRLKRTLLLQLSLGNQQPSRRQSIQTSTRAERRCSFRTKWKLLAPISATTDLSALSSVLLLTGSKSQTTRTSVAKAANGLEMLPNAACETAALAT